MPTFTSTRQAERVSHSIGQVVRAVAHTSSDDATDLKGKYGRVVAVSASHTTVEYGVGRVYVIESDLLVDAGAVDVNGAR